MSDFTAVQLLNQLTPVIITGGYVPRGAYAAGTDYAVGDSVDYNGSSYVMFVDAAAGTAPTDTTKWQVLANKGDTGSTGATGSTGSTGATGASITSAAFSSNDIVFTKDDTNTVTLTDAAITLKGATGATGGTGTLEDLGGATKALDNLASVAINTSLISDTDSTDDLGSTSKAWANLYVDTIKSITGNALALTPVSGQSLTVNLATTGDFVVNTNQLYVDTSTGNVGIGTTGPEYKLQVNGLITAGVGNNGVNNGFRIERGSAGGDWWTIIHDATSNDLNIGINGNDKINIDYTGSLTMADGLYIATDKVRARDGDGLALYDDGDNGIFVKDGGNVGIGTTGPGAKLHVYGTTGNPGAIFENTAANGFTYNTFKSPGNSSYLYAFGNTYTTSGRYIQSSTLLDANTDLSLNAGGIIHLFTSGAEKVTVLNNGNVGIGTTSPTNLLSLGGNSARIFWLERHTTANTAGNTLTVTAGGATSGATDKAGGDLILTPGLSTGTGESGVQIKGVPAGSTGTTDGTQTLMIQVLGNKLGFFAQTPVVRQTELTDELTTITFTAPGTPDYAIQDLTDSSAGATFGFATKDEGNSVLAVVANLQARVNELETKLTAYGLLIDAD